jgi:glutaryl-CoA dehydrogenase (non-decarboxylating)
MVKQFATHRTFVAASEAIQIHGGSGYRDECDFERFFRNARCAMIYEGCNEIRILIQAGYALGHRKDKALRYELPAYDPDTWQEEGER